MLTLSKKTDYALIALAYLAESPNRIASAREIAGARKLPLALLMNILKELQHHGILRSTRGAHGGYALAANPSTFSLHELIVSMEGPVRLVECASDPLPCLHDIPAIANVCRVSGHCTVQAPLQALHERLVQFLQEVRLSDVISSGVQIHVPVRSVRASQHETAVTTSIL